MEDDECHTYLSNDVSIKSNLMSFISLFSGIYNADGKSSLVISLLDA